MLILSIFVLGIGGIEAYTACASPPELGQKRPGVQPEIRYYFEQSHMACYPFKYWPPVPSPIRQKGPTLPPAEPFGFKHSGDCYHLCVPMDYSDCGYGINSSGICGHPDPSLPQNCKKGERCLGGAFFGLCCPDDKIERAWNPKCPAGKKLVKDPEGYGNLISKRCEYDFCPTGSQCVDGEFFAYCCQ